jgi:shikimate dehydrogenase
MLSGATRLVGIVGNPVAHSLSPRMQNAAFAAVGLDWAYVPVPVEPARVGEAVRGLAALGFAGANVTIPHKTAVLEHCDVVDDVARRAASVNTLVIEDGKVHGSSTDGLAVSAVTDARGADVLLVGAGGAAQAVACALVEAGAASVAVAARRPESAERLVAHLGATFAGVEARAATWPPDPPAAALIVNATPVKDELVVTPHAHNDVVDLAYLPGGRDTALVAAARAAGCARVVDGLEVLVRQGAASFERWTGIPAPIDVMREAVAQAPPTAQLPAR